MKSVRLLLGLALVGLSGCFGNTKVEPFPVGHIVPMSGPREFVGERSRQSAQLVLEELNKPEVRGALRPTLVQHADGRNGPATATRLLKVDRVLALLDSSDPLQLAGIAAAAASAETPVVTFSPWSPPPPNEHVFSLTAGPNYQGQVLARFAREELKLESVAVWCDGRIPACTVMADAFNKEWVKAGGKAIAGPMTLDPGKDLKDRVDQWKSLAPSNLVFFGNAEQLAQVNSLARQQGWAGTLLFAGDEAAQGLLSGSGLPAGKVYVVTAFVADELTPAGQEFAKLYAERYGEPLDAQAVLANEGVRLITEALRKAKTTGSGIAKEIKESTSFESLTGPLTFTKEGNANRPVFVAVLEGSGAKLAKKYGPETPPHEGKPE